MVDDADMRRAREAMVASQIAARGVHDPRVLTAMRTVPRHAFVSAAQRAHAHDDAPLPLDLGQTISQPYVVAVMSELAAIQPGDRVLEIGTGSGYQTAVLCALTSHVWSIEIVEPLAAHAAVTLRGLGLHPHLRVGDGWAGWPDAAPFDAIVVTAAPPEVPPALVAQLAPGGRLVVPVGREYQQLLRIEQTVHGLATRTIFPVRFVPMTGAALTGTG